MLEVFKCTRENEKRLSELRACAEAQQAKSYKEFEEYIEEKKVYDALTCKEQETTPKPIERMPDFILYPWQNKCAGEEYMYVSYEERECAFIKGWMHVHIRLFNSRVRNKATRKVERSTLKIAHVNYISTNQNKTKVPPGVGREMMTYMEGHMKDLNCHFVELMPLPDVVGFYVKLGYALEFKDVNYYTKWLKPKEADYLRPLQMYTYELNEENKKITKEMERAEKESFQEIYDQFTPEEQLVYHRQQEEDPFTRMSYMFVYEESGIAAVKELLV